MAYGTNVTLDTLAATQATIAEIGEDRVWAVLQENLAVHNTLLREKVADIVDFTTDRLKRYGGVDTMDMQEIDQFGTPDAQKITTGATVGFPLRRYAIGLQWTRNYLKVATGAEIAAQFTAALDADIRNMDRAVRAAFYRSTNYTFKDVLVDGVDLACKAFINADGTSIPPDPTGNTFDGATHTHFVGAASLTAAVMQTLVENIVEHFQNGQPLVWIPRGSEATVRTFTGDFTAYVDSRIIPGDDTVRASQQLNQNYLYNRAIGVFSKGGVTAEVWVKPWIPANYMTAIMTGVAQKALAYRTRGAGQGSFDVEAEDEVHPMRARVMAREFGIAAWNRVAVASVRTNNASWADPTIT